MSKVQTPTKQVVAIMISDTHNTLNPPRFRANEPDWMEVQARVYYEIEELRKKHDCIVVHAGDVFDVWNPSAELINFMIDILPNNMYGIPGQHDLPYHRYKDIEQSGYWTLVLAGKITNLEPGGIYHSDYVSMVGFPWGYDLEGLDHFSTTNVYLAVVHKYVWKDKRTSYPGAPEENKLGKLKKQLTGFDVAVFGDNHTPFLVKSSNKSLRPTIYNHGCMFRRNAPEKNFAPSVGLLYKDGSVEIHKLKVGRHDVWVEQEQPEHEDVDDNAIKEFVQGIVTHGNELSFSFSGAVKVVLDSGEVPEQTALWLRRMLKHTGKTK